MLMVSTISRFYCPHDIDHLIYSEFFQLVCLASLCSLIVNLRWYRCQVNAIFDFISCLKHTWNF